MISAFSPPAKNLTYFPLVEFLIDVFPSSVILRTDPSAVVPLTPYTIKSALLLYVPETVTLFVPFAAGVYIPPFVQSMESVYCTAAHAVPTIIKIVIRNNARVLFLYNFNNLATPFSIVFKTKPYWTCRLHIVLACTTRGLPYYRKSAFRELNIAD